MCPVSSSWPGSMPTTKQLRQKSSEQCKERTIRRKEGGKRRQEQQAGIKSNNQGTTRAMLGEPHCITRPGLNGGRRSRNHRLWPCRRRRECQSDVFHVDKRNTAQTHDLLKKRSEARDTNTRRQGPRSQRARLVRLRKAFMARFHVIRSRQTMTGCSRPGRGQTAHRPGDHGCFECEKTCDWRRVSW